jgi:hypothetical protein
MSLTAQQYVADSTHVQPRLISATKFEPPVGAVSFDGLSVSSRDPQQLRRIAEAFLRAADGLDLALVVHSEKATA